MAASLYGPTIALAQTIGTPVSAAKSEIVPSLFVLNSRGATLQGDVLTLTGHHASLHHIRRSSS
jgi:hypothetical protein